MGSTQLFGFDPSLFPHPWLDGQVNSSQVRVEVVEQWQYWHGESVAIINQFVEPCVEKPLDCNNSVESCIYKHGMYPGATQDKLHQLVTGGLLVERSTPAKKIWKSAQTIIHFLGWTPQTKSPTIQAYLHWKNLQFSHTYLHHDYAQKINRFWNFLYILKRSPTISHLTCHHLVGTKWQGP